MRYHNINICCPGSFLPADTCLSYRGRPSDGYIYSPWPEEMNRMITRCLTHFHFAPTILSKQNLLREDVKEENIIVTGNTVIDALHMVLKKINGDKTLQEELHNTVRQMGYEISKEKKFILITGHRRENFGEGFINYLKQ
jgi:UDP-N-acetylglucosamine 2-epimerase (non-hydrolysing)